MKRLITLLICVLLLGLIYSCSDTGAGTDDTVTTGDDSSTTEGAEVDIIEAIPDLDLSMIPAADLTSSRSLDFSSGSTEQDFIEAML